MNSTNKRDIWHNFAQQNSLTEHQLEQFKLYAGMLQESNERFNLTALTDTDAIIEHHFNDSLQIAKLISLNESQAIADVGTGAGFPAIPLKILYPHVPFVLIEVNNKKVGFLQQVAERLGLDGITYITDDWRTFLRHTQLPIDIFLARASLQPKELLRIFKGDSSYKHARLIYWASQHWQPLPGESAYIDLDQAYSVGGKKRRYILFADQKQK